MHTIRYIFQFPSESGLFMTVLADGPSNAFSEYRGLKPANGRVDIYRDGHRITESELRADAARHARTKQ